MLAIKLIEYQELHLALMVWKCFSLIGGVLLQLGHVWIRFNLSFWSYYVSRSSTNKDDVALVQTQSEAAKRLIQHNTSTVLNRMEWLRRNKEKKNLTNQNLKVQFSNQSLNSLVNSLASTYFANYNSSNSANLIMF